jgi:osmoprotectant transport system ATP-binding protein
MPQGAVEVRFENVALRRGRRQVLRGVDLEVNSGETLALVGPSGAGKSSLLKLINRMLLPDSGTVTVRGRPTSAWNPFDLRRGTGYVLQEIGLFPHLTVAENVGVVPRLLGWDESRIGARTREMLELVGLEPAQYASRPPAELSGGERQRVGVARALAADPPLLLMDEPFGALDPITRSGLHRQFRAIQERLRKTVVIVTHDMAEAFALATRIAVLNDASIVALDTPRAIVDHRDPMVRALLAPLIEAGTALRGGS